MTDIERLKNLAVPTGTVDCVLDTDTYNEIDDQFALSLMMKHEKCNVRALYAAPFFNNNSTSPEDGMERSYDEILNLLTLMGNEEMKKNVYRGSKTYLPDEKTPVDSPAARHLCELAMTYTQEKPLYVVAIGAITNVASALLMKPEIADRIVLVWLGGHDIHWPDTKEFNLIQDVAAARIVFGCGCPLVQLPCMGVVSAFYTTKPELEFWLKGKNPLCDYLCQHTIEEAESYAKGRVWSRVIWDVTAAAWLLNDNNRFMQAVVDHAPIPTYDGRYAFNEHRHLFLRVTHINRDALFGELFRVLAQ
ncbi:MAG: nucleoside hydrolase [Clostridia bacterium]|nr:nucleoside hydrolase [Clostridia bacterium]